MRRLLLALALFASSAQAQTLNPQTFSLPLSTANGGTGNAGGAWPSYAPTLASEAGGAIGTGNVITAASQTIGKTTCLRIQIVMGAAGMGAATQVSVTLPNTANGFAMFAGKNITTGVGVIGDVASFGFTNKILLQTTAGGVGAGNSQTTIVVGCYENT